MEEKQFRLECLNLAVTVMLSVPYYERNTAPGVLVLAHKYLDFVDGKSVAEKSK